MSPNISEKFVLRERVKIKNDICLFQFSNKIHRGNDVCNSDTENAYSIHIANLCFVMQDIYSSPHLIVTPSVVGEVVDVCSMW